VECGGGEVFAGGMQGISRAVNLELVFNNKVNFPSLRRRPQSAVTEGKSFEQTSLCWYENQAADCGLRRNDEHHAGRLN